MTGPFPALPLVTEFANSPRLARLGDGRVVAAYRTQFDVFDCSADRVLKPGSLARDVEARLWDILAGTGAEDLWEIRETEHGELEVHWIRVRV